MKFTVESIFTVCSDHFDGKKNEEISLEIHTNI